MKFEMGMDSLKDVFDAAKTFVAKDERRRALQTVQLNFYGETCTAYAADSHKLIAVVVPYKGGDEGTICVPIVKLPKGKYVAIYDEGNEIVFDFLDSKQTVKKIKGDFIKDPNAMFPTVEPQFKIAFDPRNMRDALEAFKGEYAGVVIEFTGSDKPCLIVGSNKKAIVLPVKMNN